ncbi:MAG: hypothetical protein JXR25_04370 [Pontiellaceae bacterium]|nr:hypothetical protein [Pontiellaceae bacterium]MBN2784039.1 hypothetical protein [Pontiellaceae bacterium]
MIAFIGILALFVLYSATAPKNHSEAEDVYDFALKVEQGTFADQAGVNRVLALPMFAGAYHTARALGYSGRAFPFMILINRLFAVLCVYLFWRLLILMYRRRLACLDPPLFSGSEKKRGVTHAYYLLLFAFFFAFSYGFWRYANEAETYILASVLVLAAWVLVLRGKLWWGACISALGILVHLLNLVPLLFIIPLFYLLTKEWKKSIVHGLLTGILVVVGYATCAPWLDFSELGAQHHAAEGGIGFINIVRGIIAMGQCLVSGNFLFGFESFRDFLERLFSSRMLDEEFYMAKHMPEWIAVGGCVTLTLLGSWGLLFGAKTLKRVCSAERGRWIPDPLSLSFLAWFFLYAFAVIRTEAGSPELWIMALIPFWLIVASLPLDAACRSVRAENESTAGSQDASFSSKTTVCSGSVFLRALCGKIKADYSPVWLLVGLLFAHNLIAGLMPVMGAASDYHAAKSEWLLEHTAEQDVILSSYEPVLLFYLKYYARADVLNSADWIPEELELRLGKVKGDVYALNNFFEPVSSMKVRYPKLGEKMEQTGAVLRPRFECVREDAFGGVYRMEKGSE